MQNYTEVLEKLQITIEQALLHQTINLKPVLSLKEACQYMDISSSTLYKLTSTRAIAHFCPNGKKVYFKRTDLDDWMQGNPQRTKKKINQEAAEILAQKGGLTNE